MNSSRNRQNAVKKLKTFLFTPKSMLESFREKIDETFSSVYLPNGVEREEKVFAGITCDVLSPEISASNRVLVYVHGGSFVGGSRVSYRPFAAMLSNVCSTKAVLPEFRLAPAFPFPNGIEDVEAVLKQVYIELSVSLSLDTEGSALKAPEIILAADTTGASIALAAVFRANQKLKSAIKKIVLFSPWLNFTPDDDMFTERRAQDEVFTADAVRFCAESYTYADNWQNPLVSPLKASREMLLGLPDVFLQCGKNEIFYDDDVIFSDILKNHGVNCQLDAWDNMMPLFQLADEYLKESHLALERVGSLFTRQKDDEEE